MLKLKRVVFKDAVKLGKQPDNVSWYFDKEKLDISFDKDLDSVVLTDVQTGDTIDIPRSQVKFWERLETVVPVKRGPGRPPAIREGFLKE